MQMLLVEKMAVTFAEDAHALVTGLGRFLVKIATAPIERIARACDVAGVLSESRASIETRSSKHATKPPRRCLFSFRCLNHLT